MRRLLWTAAVTAVTATTLSVATTSTATAAETLQCDTSAAIYLRKPDTSLTLYQHNEPEVGTHDWQTQVGIGHTWDGITLGGPDGVVYELTPEGQLNRFRWNGGWENGGVSDTVITGWTGWSRDTLVVDSLGDFYGIAPDGALHWRRYTKNGSTWSYQDRTLATGWAARYNMIWTSGNGTIFARSHDGNLFVHVYHAASQRWLENDRQIGWGGWNKFTDVASVGGGVFYAIDGGTRLLKWYRYTGNGTWAHDAGKDIGDGWYGDWQIEGKSDACRIVGATLPQRPAVAARLDAPNSAIQGSDGLVTFFYVNAAGGLTAAKQRYPNDYSSLTYQPFVGHQKYTGTPGVGASEDGKLHTVANSYDDAAFRGRAQAVRNGIWQPGEIAHDGWMPGDVAVVPDANKLLNLYAVDSAGALWRRAQLTANGEFGPWRKLPTSGLTSDFTVLRNGAAIDIVARFTDNSVRAARLADDSVGAWRAVGAGATGRPAVVAHYNNDLQVFVRLPNGVVHTQRESAGAFPNTWTAVGTLATTGSPAAVLRGGGMVELAARGTDNKVYQASQLVPVGGFGGWDVKFDAETATDPIGLTLSDGNPIFTWRGPQGDILTSYLNPGTAADYQAATARR
ncbi:tachylectin-related carbohydrate-binding protein [Saccharothrix australiensis]|uniref:Tachylectin n=1 Tax=Saccharothrix australiensis TaxID=2072 RepID=A0A495VVS4_9PSEU|nr:tachylectin-related carbohydrate-binding protein [Saccharothrix australiensis]RKT52475.1 tachylectin [Saccharothrix australiensis]